MRVLFFISFCLLSSLNLFGQTKEIDSLRNIVSETKEYSNLKLRAITRLSEVFSHRNQMDSVMRYSRLLIHFLPDLSHPTVFDSADVEHLIRLGGAYQFYNLDSGILFSTKALEGARNKNLLREEARASMQLGENFRLNGDLPQALENLFNALKISREIQDIEAEANSNIFIGLTYNMLGDYRIGLDYLFKGLANERVIRMRPMIPFMISNIGDAYQNLNILDSALYFQKRAASMTDSMKMNLTPLHSDILIGLGKIHAKLNEPEKAIGFFRQAINVDDYLNKGVTQYWLADLYHSMSQSDSSLHYARLAYLNSKHSFQKTWIMDAARLLAKLYSERKMTDSAYYYQGITLAYRDSLYSQENFRKLQLTAVKEQRILYENLQKKEKAEQERKALVNQIWVYSLLVGLAVFLLIAMILVRNNHQKQKANVLLKAQKEEISLQREKALKALNELKTSQAQLIQSEKMASLGELTAGIAHEIQNPLNFVNNFSEVNIELIDELKKEIALGNKLSAEELSEDIKANEEKINHHGKRADAIVKGMLQHSRSSSGVKEPTNINALADEYLRLAYYGLRAKDKSFNASMKTDFDETIGNINVVPQDIGRVILNLISNAFYAVNERVKRETANVSWDSSHLSPFTSHYEPLVKVTTKMLGDKIQISVADNGNGIPESIKEKIFQPFFTTKPTGQGTGLGLSLSYDIVKAHGGNLELDTQQDMGCTFTIKLPLQ